MRMSMSMIRLSVAEDGESQTCDKFDISGER